MADGNMVSSSIESEVVGGIANVKGTVKILRSTGEEVEAQPGAKVYLNDVLVSADNSVAIVLLPGEAILNLGYDQSQRIDQALLDSLATDIEEGSLEDAVNFDLLAQAIAEGRSLEDLLEAPAAGEPLQQAPGQGEDQTFVFFQRTGERVTPTSGFETTTFGGEPPIRVDQPGDLDTNNQLNANADPIAVDDAALVTDEDTPLTSIDVLSNDSDPDGDPLTITTVTASNGTVSINPDGTLDYTPNPDYNGPDTITYTISDGNGGTTTATVAVTVNPVNDAPVAVDDALATPLQEDTPITLGIGDLVTSNDTDVDGDTLTIVSVANPSNGTVVLNPDGTVTFTPDPNYSGPASFEYTISDGNGGTDTATVSLTVEPVNDAPVAVDDAVATPINTPLPAIDVLANDSDVDNPNSELTVSNPVLANPTQGSVSVNPDGTLNFVPANNFSGTVEVTYTLTDPSGATDTATVTITVGNNTAPEGADNSATIDEDASYALQESDFGFTDADVGQTFDNVRIDTLPAAGTLTLNGNPVTSGQIISVADIQSGNLVFAPGANEFGTPFGDFTFSVQDSGGAFDATPNTFTLNVNPINDAPVAVDDIASTPINTAIDIDVLANDSDVDNPNSALTVSNPVLTNPADGSVSINPDGSLNFIPANNFSGTVEITYTITDPDGLSDSATVTVNVGNNTPPDGADNAATIDEDTAYTLQESDFGFSDSDAGQNFANVRIDTLPSVGELTLNGNPVTAGQVISVADIQAGDLAFTPVADENGTPYADFTFSVQDSAGAFDTAPNTFSINVDPVNDAPVNTVPGAQNVDEDTALNFTGGNAISVTDVDGNLASTQLSVVNGVLNVALVGGATISAGANGSTTLTISGSEADINATLASLNYQGNANFNGSDTLTIVSTDSAGVPLSDTDTVDIIVAPVNDAPVAVDDTVSTPINTPLPSIDVLANDSDPDNANNELIVSNPVLSNPAQGSVSVNPDGTLNFTPASNVTGVVEITYTITDPGGLSDTATVTVNVGNNTPPDGADNTATIDEDTTYTLQESDFGFSDSDAGQNFANVRIDTLPGVGELTLNGNPVTAGQVIAVADIQAGDLVFTPVAEENGTPYADFTFSVQDSAGAFDTAPNTFSINVDPVNDAPVNTVPGAQNVDEDTALNFTGGNAISVTDVDGNLASTQLSVVNGVLNVTLSGSATISAGANGSDTLTISGSEADINATLASLNYQGDANFNGDDTLTVVSTDSAGVPLSDTDTVAITVDAVNDAPVNTVPGAQSVDEDTALNFTGGNTISITDVDGNLASTQLSVNNGTLNVTLAGGATISAGANGSDTLTISGSEADINATLASLNYQGDANFNGDDTLTVVSTDSAGVPLSDTDTVAITVDAVNDAPVNTVPGAQSVDEDTALNFTGGNTISVTDVDGNLASTQLSVNNGTLNVTLAGGATISAGANGSDTLTISGSEADINATLASLNYQGDANFNGDDTLTVVSTDGAGVPLSDTDTVAITVDAVNDAPVNTVPGAQSVDEDTALNFTGGNAISVTDVDGNLASTQLSVVNGVLNVTLSGSATISAGANDSDTLTISGSEADINATLASLNYQGDANFNGNDTLTVVSTDSAGVPLSDTDTVAITVDAVNDAPVNTVPGAQSVDEDTALTFTGGNTISVTDVDGNLASTQLSVNSGTLTVALSGAATISAGANGSDTLTISGSEADINATLASLNYQGDANFNGDDTLTVVSTDSAGVPLSDTDTIAITVDAVNDAPVNTVPGAQSVDEDTALNFTGGNTISVTDVDGNLASTQLSVNNGTLNVTLSGAATISAGANGSDTLTISGSEADINATLASLNYQGDANFNGDDTLTVVSTDSAGVPLSDTDTVAITVDAVNDAPVNTVPGAQSVDEDTALNFTGGNTISVTDVDGNLASTQLSVNNGTLNVTLAGGATISAGANGSDTLTISGSEADINATLASLNYQGDANFNGDDTLTVVSTDSAGVPLSDTDTVAITVDAVNDAPVNTVPGAQNVDEDTALNFTGGNTISVTDVDGNLASTQLSVNNGTLNVTLSGSTTISAGANGSDTLTISGSEADINATLASLNYQGDANFNGADTLTVVSTDSAGVPLSDTDTVAITVDAVNDAPVNTVPGAQSVDEDTALNFTGGNTISVTDVDGNLASTQLSVNNGTLNVTLSGSATISAGANGSDTLTISGSEADINATLASLNYQGDANFNGADTLTVVSTDSAGVPLSDTDTVAITVDAVNDAPVNTVPGAQSVNEDTSLTFTGGNTISVTDVDGNLASTQLSVNNGTLNVTLSGTATISAGANGSDTLTISGSEADINATLASLNYQGDANFNGADTLTVVSTDSAGVPLSDTDTVAITVDAVNDAPVNTVPGAQSVDEDTALTFTGGNTISVTDVDGNLASTQLSVNNGTLTVTLSGSATISAGANDSGTLTISGSEADINATLASLNYQGDANFNGADTLTVVSTDSAGVPLSDTDTVSITVNDDNSDTTADTNTVNEGVNATGNVLTNDESGNTSVTEFTVAGDATTYNAGDVATIAGVGTLQINGNGTYNFVPVADYSGPVPVATYTTNLGENNTLSVAITPDNNDTTADTNTVLEDNSATGNVLTNDESNNTSVTQFTVDGDGNVYTAGNTATITGVGELTINANGDYSFTPDANYSGPVPVATYTTNLGETDTLTITVTADADTPTLNLSSTAVDNSNPQQDITLPASNGILLETFANIASIDSVNAADATNLEGLMADQTPTTSNIVTDLGANAGDTTPIPVDTAIRVSGLIFLEAGSEYEFSGFRDDTLHIEIGDNTVFSQGFNHWGAFDATNDELDPNDNSFAPIADTFTPSTAGYYTFEAYIYNGNGPGRYSILLEQDGGGAQPLSNYSIYTDIVAIENGGGQHSDFVGSGDGGFYPAELNVGTADSQIALQSISAGLTDLDGSELLSLEVSAIPVGAVLSDGTNSFTATVGNTTADISSWTLDALTLTPPSGFEGNFDLTVTATATEQSNNDTATATDTISVQVIAPIAGSVATTATVTDAGNDADNAIVGSAGDDIIFGVGGSDTLIGNGGSDTFLWVDGDADGSTDTITDFIAGVGGDVLDLADLLQGEDATAATLDSYLTVTSDGTDTTITVDATGAGGDSMTVVLEGVDLTAAGTLTNQAILQQLLNDGNLNVDS